MTTIVERELSATGKSASITQGQVRAALSAKNFVAVRRIAGGPAAEALEPELLRAKDQLSTDERWLAETEQKLLSAKETRRQECDSLLRRVNGH
jgi:argininosuccinate lyase